MEQGISEIEINGTAYVPKGESYERGEHVIVIADRGWIFEGRMAEEFKLTEAHVVRKWSNGMGIGGLQTAEHRGDYTLDALPSGIELRPSAVIAVLPIKEW